MKDYGAVYRGLAYAALESTFGMEFINLDSQVSKLVAQDFTEASLEDGLSARDYAKRIGKGNLASYGETMKARYARGW